MPDVYTRYGRRPDGSMPEINFPNFKSTLTSEGSSEDQKRKKELKTLGIKLGWPKGKQPNIYEMAKQSRLEEIYEFFYRGTSKAVHASLHNMLRMVWGTPGKTFTITSHNFESYYVRFSLVYGVWLVSEIFERIVQLEFPTLLMAMLIPFGLR